MSEATIIMDGSNPQKENEERTRIATQPSFKKDLAHKVEESQNKHKTLKGVAAGVAVVGAAGALMSFMPSKPELVDPESPIVLPDDPPMAEGVNDLMSYDQAWEEAREEVGAGGFFVWHGEKFSTYTQEEWAQIPVEDQQEFTEDMNHEYEEYIAAHPPKPIEEQPIVIHDDAPVSHVVNDSMSFNDAFTLARQDVGAGGVFVWHGKTYNTYYKEEWDAMDEADQNQFMASADHHIIQTGHSTETIAHSNVYHNTHGTGNDHHEVVDNAHAEVFVKDEMIEIEGKQIHVGHFVKEGKAIIKMDMDNDNQYDYIVDEEHHQLIGLNGHQDVDLNNINNTPEELDPSRLINTQNTTIEGHDAKISMYADGHQEAEVDMDGDGIFDSKISIDVNGHVQVFDNNNQLVVEDDIPTGDLGGDIAEPIVIAEPDMDIEPEFASNDIIDDQLNDHFGDDFNDYGDVSGWSSDEDLLA